MYQDFQGHLKASIAFIRMYSKEILRAGNSGLYTKLFITKLFKLVKIQQLKYLIRKDFIK